MTRAIIVNMEHNYTSYGHQKPTDDNFETMPHATIQALIKARREDIVGGTIFLARFPCYECAKAIVFAELTKVVYKEENTGDAMHSEARMFLEYSGIEVVQNPDLEF